MTSNLDAEKARHRARWKTEFPKDPALKTKASEALCSHIRKTEFFPKAKRIGLFVSRERELNVLELWDPTRCCFPKVLPDGRLEFYRVAHLGELTPGYQGILEPPALMPKWVTDWRPFDIILVPGAAFDRFGGRIGTGLGFYDRFLSTTAARPWATGWEAQLVNEPLPMAANDIPMWAIATEAGWRRVEAQDSKLKKS